MKLLTFEQAPFSAIGRSWRQILEIGLPAVTTNLIVPATNAIIVAFVAAHGASAVAGFNVATRLEFLALVPFYALAAIVCPFVGQNLGAGKRERIVRAFRLSATFCVVWGLASAGILAVVAPWFVTLFNSNPEVIATAKLYLWLVPVSFTGLGIVLVGNGALNGFSRPLPAAILAILRSVGLYIPLAYFASSLIGLCGIFTAASLANLVAGTVAYRWNMDTFDGDQ